MCALLYEQVVMDEPTANIDTKTDDAIQNLVFTLRDAPLLLNLLNLYLHLKVRSEFKDNTLITIAHRISTIIG